MKSKQAASQKQTSENIEDLPADRFINRELSWLEFNERVLDQAADPSLPLLERAKFLAISSSNLDEFMMVRVGSLQMQYRRNSMVRDASGLTVGEQLMAVAHRCDVFTKRQYNILSDSLEPLLAEHNVKRIDLNDCSDRCQDTAERRFRSDVLAVISPQAIFEERPFPLLQGLGVHLCIRLKSDQKSGGDPESSPWDFAVIPLGRTVPRVVLMPSDRGHSYVLLEDLIRHFIGDFFPGREIVECIAFRITRNADIELQEDAASDLMVGMEEVLESRRQSRVTRLEYSQDTSDAMLAFLSEKMQVRGQDLYPISGPLDLSYLFTLYGLEGFDALRNDAWPPQRIPRIDPSENMFSSISRGDILLLHPYESFDPIVRLIEEASIDPDVLAIKQVLYRTSRNSPIISALKRAAENGKFVSVIVELKARFDEARNIEWAREMEQSGVQVIYGIRGLKTHAKICIIVRREPQGIVRYMHFGTGNYNEVTATLYGDVSLLTCNEEIGADASAFFNAVTGASQPQKLRHLDSAPTTLRKRIIDLINAETQRCIEGQRAEIFAKINALVDTEVIDALYRASQAGVKIQLNVRGVCCLRPGVPGLSENIRVNSIVDRFLEHARIMHFRHGGDSELFISSADWMPRNLDRRVEIMVPIDDIACREKLMNSLLTYFQDNCNSWEMQADGSYIRSQSEKQAVRAQKRLYENVCKATEQISQKRRTTFETHEPPNHR